MVLVYILSVCKVHIEMIMHIPILNMVYAFLYYMVSGKSTLSNPLLSEDDQFNLNALV